MKSNIRTKFAGLAVVLAFLAPSLTFAQESKTYIVKPGDTLSEIAETHNTTVEKLAKLNNIKNIHLIYVDQVLVIDGEAPVVAATPATTKPAAPATTDVSATTEAPAPAAVEETPVVEETSAPAAATPTPAAESTPAPAATVSGSEATF